MSQNPNSLIPGQSGIDYGQKAIDSGQKDVDSSQKGIDSSQKDIDPSQKAIDSSHKDIGSSQKALDSSQKDNNSSQKAIDQNRLVSVDFEVVGKLQGVFFRKFTQTKAKELGLNGWVMNGADGSVIGQIQGIAGDVETLKVWLQHVGSPNSEIVQVSFTNEMPIDNLKFKKFEIRR